MKSGILRAGGRRYAIDGLLQGADAKRPPGGPPVGESFLRLCRFYYRSKSPSKIEWESCPLGRLNRLKLYNKICRISMFEQMDNGGNDDAEWALRKSY